ncbi:MAG: MarR family transcriptional regulator [Myxococcales bacterium]|nr:MarR family transcriptional regulator [Myxococcales bacterium]MDD9964681.1 MarR family transcriptional regulator [Myxococcales bacterium]
MAEERVASSEVNLVLLNSALTQLMRRIRAVDERQGVGRARLAALAVLRFGGACSASELAEREMVSRVTMHHILTGLERDGLIRRSPDPNDGRRQHVLLTARGRATIDRAHRARIAYLQELAGAIEPEQLAVACEVLDALRNAASRA